MDDLECLGFRELLAKARSINSEVNDSYGERELISIIQRGA